MTSSRSQPVEIILYSPLSVADADASFLGGLFEREIAWRNERLLDTAAMQTYYRALFSDRGRSIPVSVFGYLQRLLPALRACSSLPDGARILDAGCGYGTESLIFSLMGKNVTGIDLVSERVELARSRRDFYQSLCAFPLEVDFRSANIFGLLRRCDMFDAIWVMEAISHIHPAEEFLSLARRRLTTGGRLIISDPNRISPLAWLRSVKIRGSIRHKPHQRFKDPETGWPVDYGQERIFSVRAARRLLRRFGFRIQEVHVTGFMGTSLLPRKALETRTSLRLLSSLDKAAKRVPVLKSLGSIYTIVAVKADKP